MSNKVTIIDYGLGNLFNVGRAFEHAGAHAQISDDPKVIAAAERLILPGVGAFGEGMKGLTERKLIEPILEFVSTERPFIGVCLGMQLMLSTSEELGSFEGLNLIEGHVEKLHTTTGGNEVYKIPQIGWNTFEFPTGRSSWKNTVLDSIGEQPYAYFLHSYVCNLKNKEYELALTDYGSNRFCSVFQKGNIIGFQPHPERSSEVGLKILGNFVKL